MALPPTRSYYRVVLPTDGSYIRLALSARSESPRSLLPGRWASNKCLPQTSSADRTGAPAITRSSPVANSAPRTQGSRCITTDANGVVGVWKTDQKGMLSSMCHYKKAGALNKARAPPGPRATPARPGLRPAGVLVLATPSALG